MENKINIGSDTYISYSREEILEYSKQDGLRKALYFDSAYKSDEKIKCVIVANHKGWITAVTEKGAIIQEWAGCFHLGMTEVE